MKSVLCGLFAALLFAAPVAAQDFDDPISTDRPGFGFATSVVAPGRVQIEAGTPNVDRTTSDADLLNRVISFPTQFRIGLVDRLELRLGSGVYGLRTVETAGGEDQETGGFPGVTVGAKASLLDAPRVAVALIPRVSLPIGDDRFTNPDGRLGFSADAVLNAPLGSGLAVTVVGGGALDPNEPTSDGYDYRFSGNFNGNVSYGLDDGISLYAEGVFLPREDVANAGYLGAGATYQPVPTAQLDVFFDRGLTDGASDWLFGGGISIRFGD